MKFGNYNSFNALKHAYETKEIRILINHFKVFDNIKYSSSKPKMIASYLLRIIIPLAILISINEFTYHSDKAYIAIIVVVLFNYLFDISELTFITSFVLAIIGYSFNKVVLVLIGISLIISYFTNKLSWAAMQDCLAKDVMLDEDRFTNAWTKMLVMIRDDKMMYSFERSGEIVKKGELIKQYQNKRK